jgi:hypothetical protein
MAEPDTERKADTHLRRVVKRATRLGSVRREHHGPYRSDMEYSRAEARATYYRKSGIFPGFKPLVVRLR